MEFWFSGGAVKFRLPVSPPEFNISRGNNNSVLNVESLGEITLLGNKKLASVEFNSFFPSRNYNFTEGIDLKQPYIYVGIINKWIEKKKVLRFFITQTDVDIDCIIEEFVYGENDGTGDVAFSMRLKEYVAIDTKKRKVNLGIASMALNRKTKEKEEEEKTYTVKEGDNLTFIAKKHYGDGNRWPEIYEKNKDVIGDNPNLIKPGQVLKL